MNKENKIKLLSISTSITMLISGFNVNALRIKNNNFNDNRIVYEEEYEDNEINLVFTTYEEMISFYSKVFQLKEDIINNKITSLMNDNPYAWEYENILNNKKYNSKEEAILKVVGNISNDPKKYNLSEKDIREKEYKLKEYLPEELIYKYSEVLGVNPNIALAVAYGESGRGLNSTNFKKNHNVAGLHPRKGFKGKTSRSGYAVFRNEAEGLYRYVVILHDNFEVKSDSGINKIRQMSCTYCSNPRHWRGLVGSIYYELKNNGYNSIYNRNRYKRELIYPADNDSYILKK